MSKNLTPLQVMMRDAIRIESELSSVEVPPNVKAALIAWRDFGHLPGSFVTNVLQNDLMGAYRAADMYSAEAMYSIVQFIYNDMPSASHGSVEAMTAWQKRFVSDDDFADDEYFANKLGGGQ